MASRTELVYVVDDEADVRAAFQDLLAAHGRESLAFASAAEYLAHPRDDRAACLLLDLELPSISGLELQQRLGGANAPPIVFVSGRGTVPASVRAMKAGAVEFLTKPVDPLLLLAAVDAALEQARDRRRTAAELDGLRERYARLTPREREVLPLVASGLRNKQAAAALGITEVTLQVHRGQVMKKMGATSFADLVRMASALDIEPAPTPSRAR